MWMVGADGEGDGGGDVVDDENGEQAGAHENKKTAGHP
jgi:hypothetical protein